MNLIVLVLVLENTVPALGVEEENEDEDEEDRWIGSWREYPQLQIVNVNLTNIQVTTH